MEEWKHVKNFVSLHLLYSYQIHGGPPSNGAERNEFKAMIMKWAPTPDEENFVEATGAVFRACSKTAVIVTQKIQMMLGFLLGPLCDPTTTRRS
jgi:hypothetical protein